VWTQRVDRGRVLLHGAEVAFPETIDAKVDDRRLDAHRHVHFRSTTDGIELAERKVLDAVPALACRGRTAGGVGEGLQRPVHALVAHRVDVRPKIGPMNRGDDFLEDRLGGIGWAKCWCSGGTSYIKA
jgi:hypothetical protein